MIPFAQAGGPPVPQTSQSDGATMVHGLWPEDFLDGIVCLQCAETSRTHGEYNFERYAQCILDYHGVEAHSNLINRKSPQAAQEDFTVWFSGQPTPNENEPQGFIEKLARWNQRMKEYAGMRGQ